MSEDLSDTPPRESTATEQQFASLAMLQGMLLLHALLAGFIGYQAWKLSLGFGVMGADRMADFYAIHIFYLVVIGPTPALNLLAIVHAESRPSRAKRYLRPALVFAWVQAACGMLIAIPFAAFILPLFLAALYAFIVGVTTKAANEMEPGSVRGRLSRRHLTAIDLTAALCASAVLAIPVAVLDSRYHVF